MADYLILFHHAQRDTPHCDSHITTSGARRTRKVARNIARYDPSMIISSPYQRCIETSLQIHSQLPNNPFLFLDARLNAFIGCTKRISLADIAKQYVDTTVREKISDYTIRVRESFAWYLGLPGTQIITCHSLYMLTVLSEFYAIHGSKKVIDSGYFVVDKASLLIVNEAATLRIILQPDTKSQVHTNYKIPRKISATVNDGKTSGNCHHHRDFANCSDNSITSSSSYSCEPSSCSGTTSTTTCTSSTDIECTD